MDVKAALERAYPYLIGFAAAGATLHYGVHSIGASASSGVDARQIASAMLNVFGLLTGLLFSIYVLAIAPGGGFIERIFNTATFAVFRRYVVEALMIGAMATAAVVPLMATEVAPDRLVWSASYLAPTFFLGATSLAAFFRVAHIFIVWVGITARRGSPPKRG